MINNRRIRLIIILVLTTMYLFVAINLGLVHPIKNYLLNRKSLLNEHALLNERMQQKQQLPYLKDQLSKSNNDLMEKNSLNSLVIYLKKSGANQVSMQNDVLSAQLNFNQLQDFLKYFNIIVLAMKGLDISWNKQFNTYQVVLINKKINLTHAVSNLSLRPISLNLATYQEGVYFPGFSLSQLHMQGFWKAKNDLHAVVQNRLGQTVLLSMGDYLSRSHAKVVEIEPGFIILRLNNSQNYRLE